MSDLISRQAAIAYAISGRVRTLPTSEDGENWIRTEDVRQSLLSMPSAEPQWIPVTARFPEEKTDVLVCNDDGKMGVAFIEMVEWLPNYISPEWRIKYCLYDSDSWDQDENGEITAWMPLPKPYKGDKE